MSQKGQVKSYTRKTKSGKTVTVKAHTRKSKGGASIKKGAGKALRKLFKRDSLKDQVAEMNKKYASRDFEGERKKAYEHSQNVISRDLGVKYAMEHASDRQPSDKIVRGYVKQKGKGATVKGLREYMKKNM